MTGTASTFTEYNDAGEQQQRFLNRFSGWLFGHNDKLYGGCRLIDISECGGALLIPRSLTLPHDTFDLIIHHSVKNRSANTIVRARLRWSDIDYSETDIKIGFSAVLKFSQQTFLPDDFQEGQVNITIPV